MQHSIIEFLRRNNLKIDQDFNCFCSVIKKHDSIKQVEKSPFRIIFQEKSVVLLRINAPKPKEYRFGYEHIIDHSLHGNKLRLSVKDWFYDNMYFEFDFLFIFNKYILDPFSVKKADFETVVGKELYVVYSTSWYDDKKEMEGVLTRVGDLRIYIDDINNQKQEIEIFDLAYFFARLQQTKSFTLNLRVTFPVILKVIFLKSKTNCHFMREEFNELNVPDGHYLKIAKNSGNIYFDEFIESVSKIKQFISNRDFKDLWGNKLQLKKAKFDEKAYIQSACELAVANYFCEKNGFRVEAKVNPKNQKDVDVKFQSNNFTYNIEVKCAAFTNREKVQNTESFKYQTYGRLDNRLDIMSILSNAIDEGLIKQGKSLKEHSELKSMDNNLKDFLINAHEKFNDLSKENEINILLICCGDREDMQSWVGYLNGPEGLFTNGSFCDPADYNNVDLVILTNLYYKHKDFYNKNIENSWNLNETLNLSIINPYCRLRKPKGIENFDSEMINYNSEINQFKVPGLAPEVLKDARKVVHFVIDYLEIQEGKYLFDKKSSN